MPWSSSWSSSSSLINNYHVVYGAQIFIFTGARDVVIFFIHCHILGAWIDGNLLQRGILQMTNSATKAHNHISVVMDMGTATRDRSRVRSTMGQGQVRKFLPVTIPYPFGRVTGMWQITSTFCYNTYHHLTHTQRSTMWTPDDTKMGRDKRWRG